MRSAQRLTHWGRATHICVGNLTIIGSDNGLSPDRRQVIIWTNAGIFLTGTLGTNFSEFLIEILTFSYKDMHLKMSSGKWRPFCPGLNVLSHMPCPSYCCLCLPDDFFSFEIQKVCFDRSVQDWNISSALANIYCTLGLTHRFGLLWYQSSAGHWESLLTLVEAEWRIYASSKSTTIVSDNGLSLIGSQAIIWTNAYWLIINWILGNNFRWNFNQKWHFSFT